MVAALLLLVCPGAWLAFLNAGSGRPWVQRLALGVVLSPLVVALEFYLLRLGGLSFEATAAVIAVANLPSLVLVARAARGFEWDPRAMLAWSLCLVLPIAFLVMFSGDPQDRASHGHAWNHAGIAYLIANGELRPEEPQLAGVRMVYPWLGHVYQGVMSFVADVPPNSSYLVTNVAWLLATIALVVGIVVRLGGDRIAQASSVAWLCFGVNVMGIASRAALPRAFLRSYKIWGDARYTPWLRKFAVFEQTILGIGIFAAVLAVLVDLQDNEPDPGALMLLGPLMVSAALVYPVLYPATMALVGGHFLYLLASRAWDPRRCFTSANVGLASLAVVSALVGVTWLKVITADHAGAATMGLSDAYGIKTKVATSLVVLAPLLGALAATGMAAWRKQPRATALLAFGAGTSVLLHGVLSIYYNTNEYKFIFVAAICLVPFAALATARALRPAGRAAPWGAAALSVVLAAPNLARTSADTNPPTVALDLRSFSLALRESEPLSAVLTAVRTSSPPNAVLVSAATTMDLASLTRRPIYVQMDTGTVTLGIGLKSEYLLKLSRGYSRYLVDARRASVRALFEGDARARDAAALRILGDVARPVVVIVRRPDDQATDTWLASDGRAQRLYSSESYGAWVLTPAGLRGPREP